MIYITRDFDKAESSGREGYFQVISIIKDYEDLTHLIDVGTFYANGEAVIRELGLDPNTTDWEYDD